MNWHGVTVLLLSCFDAVDLVAGSYLQLLVGRQEGRLACKTEW